MSSCRQRTISKCSQKDEMTEKVSENFNVASENGGRGPRANECR